MPYAESDSGSDGCGNRLLPALDAPRWVGDGDRTRDIQVHNLVSGWSVPLFREWKRRMQRARSAQDHQAAALCPIFSTLGRIGEHPMSSMLPVQLSTPPACVARNGAKAGSRCKPAQP